MSPDKRTRRNRGGGVPPAAPSVRTKPGPDDPYEVVYYKRHAEDDPREAVPGREFLAICPPSVRALLMAVAAQVAAGPPHKFVGGGYWKALSRGMAGYHEIRVNGPMRTHYRLFCRLDTKADGRGPLLVILCGESKRFGSDLSDSAYRRIRALGEEYEARNPRSVI
jgi:hypothetical protein